MNDRAHREDEENGVHNEGTELTKTNEEDKKFLASLVSSSFLRCEPVLSVTSSSSHSPNNSRPQFDAAQESRPIGDA